MSGTALLVGSSFSAIPLFFALKRRGLRVEVCGNLPGDPCHQYADASHAIDYSDREALLAVARENAVEGCVRETYGALLAAYQARAARDPRVREELAVIAADEARHAELSWDVHRWIMGRPSEDERATIRLAMSAAIAELGRELAIEPSDDVVETAGMPTRAVALTLFAALGAHVRPLAA